MARPLGNGRFHNTHRISAVFPYLPPPDAEDALDSITDCKRIVVMDEVKLRRNRALITSLAVQNGFDAVLFTEDVQTAYSSYMYRYSNGLLFDIPLGRVRSWPDDLENVLKARGFTCVAMALRKETLELDDPKLKSCERIALLLGREDTGLTEEVIDGCDYTVKIPGTCQPRPGTCQPV